MDDPKRILSLQPYWGGSHQQFHDGWIQDSQFEWTTLTLPPRHWKWRMRHASIFFSEEINKRTAAGESWDAVYCTDMLNLADFKGLVCPAVSQLPCAVYFHENQFAYPSQYDYQRDQHFPFTNFITALAADEIWFNSQFNFDSMLEGLHRHAKRWPDFVPETAIESLESKKRIEPPGIESPPFPLAPHIQNRLQRASQKAPIRIVWAARWEHDKNPIALFEALEILVSRDQPFEISLIGQTFPRVPEGIDKIKEAFPERIRRWGFQPTRLDYWKALAEADVFVSTANHEFFGLSAAESIAAGVFPLLPNRLAYPELLAYSVPQASMDDCLYDGTPDGLANSLGRLIRHREPNSRQINPEWAINPEWSNRLISHIGWSKRTPQLDAALSNLIESKNTLPN